MALSTVPELTAEQVQSILVQPLEAASVFLAAGPRIFDTDGSPVRIPTLVSGTDPDWLGPSQLIDEGGDGDPAFDEVTLMPSTMKSLKVLVRASNELVRQSVVALDAAIRDRLVRDVAGKLDTALLVGDGDTGTTPLGLFNYSGVQDMSAVGPLTLDALHDAVGLSLSANVNVPATRWLMSPRDFIAIRKMKDKTGRTLIAPDPTTAGAFQLLGQPVTVTGRIPSNGGDEDDESQIALVDFSTIAVARDLAPTVKILDQTFGHYDEVGIRVVTRYDAAPLLPEATVILRGVQLPAEPVDDEEEEPEEPEEP